MKINLEYYFGEWTPWMFLIIPVFMIMLPLIWIYSILRLIFGCFWLGWDFLRGNIKKEDKVPEEFEDLPVFNTQEP